MGAIVLNELIASYQDVPFENIVYMAAATSIREFAGTVPLVLKYQKQKNCQSTAVNCPKHLIPQFYSLLLHPLRDARERTAWGMAPTGSLLEWIDDMYEGPDTLLDRTLGMWRNLYPSIHVFDQTVLNEQMNFRVFGMLGARKRPSANGVGQPDSFCRSHDYWPADPDTHSAMNDNESCFWTKSFWKSTRPAWAMGQNHGPRTP
jgi:hypothetical protein